ncbi:hypothetical protein CYLTODRAFT_414892 [Cylindrobasidium torrendii FP15055 ss-10]|uniref:C2H2-type domain-containing protein n=1 Tax=Cylindrobasidium torrendii FP15055 ss-10 TaxID=1314674 RepID=A0A0D7AWK8_9AGAR|nr:hypothetical protein CYLTODRAFT_414892 [Cylindrobasidium torrendii FP15055 ss-10]
MCFPTGLETTDSSQELVGKPGCQFSRHTQDFPIQCTTITLTRRSSTLRKTTSCAGASFLVIGFGTLILYKCTAPECTRYFTTHGSMVKHLKQSASCSWWVNHVQEAEVNQPVTEGVVPGSIHDLHPADIGGAGDQSYGEPDVPPPLADDKSDDDDASEASDNKDMQDDQDIEEADARTELIRRWIEEQPEDSDLFLVQHPDVAIGEPGPGPSTMRSRLGQMVGARARFLEDDDGENELEKGNGDIIVEHPTAGRASVATSSTLYARWHALFGHKDEPDED